MEERVQLEFSLVRYIPDLVKNEFVNIGVVLKESGRERTELRFTRDWARVRCIDPLVNLEMLEDLEEEWRVRIGESPELMELLRASLSNMVQMTEPKGCMAETFQTQMDVLMRMYVETNKQPREQRKTGRAAIHGEMRKRFEREGVWELMSKRIAAARYTQAGDPLRIDCGYRPNGMIRMFQAVSLVNDVEGAKGLAFSAPYLMAGVQAKENAKLELSAIIEPIREVGEEQERVDQYRFGVETMERQQIRVLTVADLDRVAAAARVEFHL